MGIYSNYRFTLDIQKKNSQASIPVVYKDTGRHFYITLKDGGIPFAVPDECTVFIVINKPRGNPLVNSCIIENSIVHYEFNDLTANQEGVHKCELRLYDSDKRLITSPSFTMIVDERVVYDDEIATKEDVKRLNALGVIASEGERQKAEAARVEAEEARAAAEAARVEAENGREAKIAAKEDKADANALRVRVSDLEVGKEDKVDADIVRKRVTNLEARLSDDMFITNSEVAYERAVPAPVAPYAEVNKIGGMSYAVNTSKNLWNPAEVNPAWQGYNSDASIYGDEDGNIHIEGVFTEGDSKDAWFAITPPHAGRYTFSADFEVVQGALSFYYSIAGSGTDDNIIGRDGTKYACTFDFTDSIGIYITIDQPKYGELFHVIIKTMLNEGETALPWESPNKKELLSTPVTKLESAGKNLLDISKGLSENLKDNGDGTYTISKTDTDRFSADIPLYIPAGINAVIGCKINKYSNSAYNFVGIQAITSDGNSNRTYPMRDQTINMISNDFAIVKIRLFLDSTVAVGDYVTFSEPQIEIGTVRTDYAPYSADPIDTFEIPEAVQAYEGYGEGVSGDYSNRIVFNEDGTVHYRKEMYDFVYDKSVALPVKDAISGQTTTRYYLRPSTFTELQKRIYGADYSGANSDKISKCAKLGVVSYAEDKVGYYLDTASSAIYFKSPYSTAQETADWLDGTVFKLALAEPEIIDITELMPKDNFIKVQSNGRIVAVNEHSQAAPTTITYQKEG